MAQTLEYNASINQVSAVTIPVFDEDMDIIQKLDDEPNDVGGLTAAQLKAEFDAAGKRTQDYINNELIPVLVSEAMTEASRANAEAERVANEQERVRNEEARVGYFMDYSAHLEMIEAQIAYTAMMTNTLLEV